jgi:hypothetical protein
VQRLAASIELQLILGTLAELVGRRSSQDESENGAAALIVVSELLAGPNVYPDVLRKLTVAPAGARLRFSR